MLISKNLQMHAVQCKYSNTALIDLISDKQKKVQSRALGGLALIGSPTSSSSAKASKNAALIPWNYFESFPKWYMIVAGLAHITDLIGMVQALNNQFLIPNCFLYSVDDHRGCKRWVLNGCRREGFNLVPV